MIFGIVSCYRCHEPGHTRAECPREQKPPAAVPRPDGRAAVPGWPPQVPPRRPAEEIADYAVRSAEARAALGFDGLAAARRLQALAREQVAESRYQRRGESLFVAANSSGVVSPPG